MVSLMPVSFSNKPEILVVHGVQTGENQDMRQNEVIKDTLDKLIADPALHFETAFEFTTKILAYEDINDDASYLVRRILASMTGNSIAGWVVDEAADLISDVLLAISQGDVYEAVKAQIKNEIQLAHSQGRPVYLVAHSLGSFYALEVINDLMANWGMAKSDKSFWPVHGLITIGSPLGLSLFKRDHSHLNRRKIGVNVTSKPRFPWKNYWDRQDPIVTGNIMGFPRQSDFPIRFDRQMAKPKGWNIRVEEVNAGHTAHLGAHTAYWHDSTVGQGIVNMLYVDKENY